MLDGAVIEVEKVFHESGLKGRVQTHVKPTFGNVLYVLPRKMRGPHGEDEAVCLDIILREDTLDASVVLEESGAVVYEREVKPTTVDNARDEAKMLVQWALRS